METTGCKFCDLEQRKTGDRTAMCMACETGRLTFVIRQAARRRKRTGNARRQIESEADYENSTD